MILHIRRGFMNLFPQNASLLRKFPVSSSNFFTIHRFLEQRHYFHPQAPSKLPSTLKEPQESSSTLSFMKESGFSQTQLDKILKSWPQLVSVNLDRILKPKIKIFQEFGFSEEEIAGIISKDPTILHCSAKNRFIPSLSVLKDMLGSTSEVAKLLKISSWYIRSNLTNTLLPNIQFLKSCGMGMEKITWLMYYFPRFLLRRPENIEEIVERADRMGADRNSKMYVRALTVVGSMNDETLQLKVEAFRDIGFSEDEISTTLRLEPGVFGISSEKIKEVGELVLSTGKYDLSCIVKYPSSLGRSIEKRYKPRFQVLRILEDKKLIKDWPGFYSVYRMTDDKFYEKFVGPNLNEVGGVWVYVEKSSDGGKGVAKVIQP